MISFDLKCALGHVFEAWFRSSDAYEVQRNGGLIACPLCGGAEVEKAVMAPAVAAKGNTRAESKPGTAAQSVAVPGPDMDQMAVRTMLNAIAEVQAKMLETSQWVGDRFADKARAMHYGEIEQAAIHGTANADETRAMLEEGLPVAPLIVPVVPPDQTH